MRIGLITADPGHQLLADTADVLTPHHEVVALDPGGHQTGGRTPSPPPGSSPMCIC
ncbi:hypothetical protein ACFQ2Y_42590 [Streptomyces malaysiensis subsp. malaysiensis]